MSTRTKELAAIHVAKKKLFGSDDELYRAFLESVTGKTSAKDLDERERRSVLEAMRKNGFERTRERVRIDPAEDTPQVQMIKQLWLTLYQRKAAKSDEEAALLHWVKRQTGIDHYRWLSPEQASKCIEMLKAWLGRLRRSAA